jgi:methyl-accepting chemotaxis protein
MESKYKRINFIIIIVFIIFMIITTLQLFSLSDELILGVSSLSTDNISELSNVLSDVYIFVALTFVIGLVAILLNFKTDLSAIGVQHTANANSSDSKETKNNEQGITDTAVDLDLSAIHKALKDNGDKKQKHTAALTAICKNVEAGQAAIYLTKESKGARILELYTSYAFHIAETETLSFTFGEGLVGQVAVEENTLVIDEIPDNYINIVSGLGSASPKHLLITPLTTGKKTIGVVEFASFTPFSKEQEKWIKESLHLLVTNTGKKTTSEVAPKKKKAEK